MDRHIKRCIIILIGVFIAILALLTLASCSTGAIMQQRTLLLNNVRQDSIRHLKTQKYNMIIKDTMVVTLNEQGDTTMRVEKHHSNSRIEIHDTLYINNTDTVRVPVTIKTKKIKKVIPPILILYSVLASIISFGLIIVVWRNKAH